MVRQDESGVKGQDEQQAALDPGFALPELVDQEEKPLKSANVQWTFSRRRPERSGDLHPASVPPDRNAKIVCVSLLHAGGGAYEYDGIGNGSRGCGDRIGRSSMVWRG